MKDGRFHEVHPEVSFAAMNAQKGGQIDRYAVRSDALPKTAFGGLVERRELLKEFFGSRFKELEARAAKCDGVGRVAPDDFYDALACLWTARRVYEGVWLALPKAAPLPMRRASVCGSSTSRD